MLRKGKVKNSKNAKTTLFPQNFGTSNELEGWIQENKNADFSQLTWEDGNPFIFQQNPQNKSQIIVLKLFQHRQRINLDLTDPTLIVVGPRKTLSKSIFPEGCKLFAIEDMQRDQIKFFNVPKEMLGWKQKIYTPTTTALIKAIKDGSEYEAGMAALEKSNQVAGEASEEPIVTITPEESDEDLDYETKVRSHIPTVKTRDASRGLEELTGWIAHFKRKEQDNEDLVKLINGLEQLENHLKNRFLKIEYRYRRNETKQQIHIEKSAALRVLNETNKMLILLESAECKDKPAAIAQYQNECKRLGVGKTILNILTLIVVSAVAFVGGFVVGAGAGILTGVYTGPGVAVTAGAGAAIGAVAASTIAAVSFGLYLFKPKGVRKDAVEVGDLAKKFYATSPAK